MAPPRGSVNPSDGTARAVPVGGPYAGQPVIPGGGTTLPYTIIRADGTRVTGGTGTPTATADTPAKAQLKLALESWGLGDLVDWAWQQLTSGASNEQVMLSLREQPAYKTRFAGNEARKAQGLQPLSEAQYLAYETQARQMMRAAGLPTELFDKPDDFARYIANDVSVAELSERVQIASTYAANDPTVSASQRAEMQRLYGVGGLAAYYLDPGRALPALQRQVAAAESAAVAKAAGFGSLDRLQAEKVGELSASVQQTQQAFAQLVRQRELMTALPGELGVDGITADEQINATLGGDAMQAERISRRARKRQADFSAAQGDYQVGLGRSTTSAL